MPQQSRTSRPLVVASIMASMCMIAIEATIVSTAMPQIAAELGGLRLYAWVFSAFLLSQTAMTVVFGKLSDIYGRKPMVLGGIAIFLVGSIAAGFAWSMPSLIAFRLIQGVGAGAIQPIVMTIVGDLYPARERGKVQGYLASVWATAAIVGPLLGALIIQKFSWAWIFWMNIPVGIAAGLGFIFFLHEAPRRKRASIDVVGAGLFTAAVAALMFTLTDAGSGHEQRAWLAGGIFCVCLVLFILQERRAADPMVSFDLWSRKAIAVSNGAMLFSNMVIIGVTTFLPMYVQGVLHRTPTVAGLTLTMIMVGWPVGSIVASRLFPRFGLRPVIIGGSVLIPLGTLVFIFLKPDSSPLLAGAGSLVMGLGMGLMSVCSLVLVQEVVDVSERGSATASNMFSRNLGSTIGAAVLGAVFNYGLANSKGVEAVTSEQLKRVLEAGSQVLSGLDSAVEMAMQQSLHVTFWTMFVISVVAIGMSVLLPSISLAREGQGTVKDEAVQPST